MIPPTISFVIPVLNEGGRIATLLQLLASRYPDSERIVVDGGSNDTTVAEARLYCTNVIESTPGRAIQMNEGAKAATGTYLFFLHADTIPTINSLDLLRYLKDEPAWGFFQLRLSGAHWMFRVIEGAINLRSRVSGVATGDQMLFVKRTLYEQTGGYAPIPLMEDVEYCKRLRHDAKPLVVGPAVETSSRRWEQQGVVSTVVQMWCLRLAFFLGVSPDRLKAYYE